MSARLIALYVLLSLGLMSSAARAQVETLMAAGSPGLGGGHGWVIVPRDFERFSLMHMPPRTIGAAGKDDSAPSGTVRRVMSLAKPPVAMAAVDDRLVLIYEPSPDGPQSRWPVRSLRAVSQGHGLYTYAPGARSGGFEIKPSLLDHGEIRGAAGALGRVFVLTEAEGSGSLWSFNSSQWTEHALPPAFAVSPTGNDESTMPRQVLAGHPDRIAVVDHDGAVWLGSFEGEALAWELQTQSLAVDPNTVSRGHRLWLGDGPGRWRIAGDEVEIDRLEGDETRPLARSPVAKPRVAAVPMARDGRLALLWFAEPTASNERAHIAEVSVWTGRSMFDGPAEAGGPVSTRDFQMLSLMLLAIATGVLVFIVRQPAGADAQPLPSGTALAPPSQRAAATMIDWVMIATIAATVLDAPLSGTLSLVGLALDPALRASGGLGMMVATLLMAWVWGTVFEGALGVTPGKWLVGVRVTPMEQGDEPGRAGLARSALRNAFKWGLIPWAAAEAMTPGVRHRGDLAARVAVVVELDDDDE